VVGRETYGTRWSRDEGAVVGERRRRVGVAVGEGWGRCFPAEGKRWVVRRRRLCGGGCG